MGVTSRGFKKFEDWVDAHGEDAGNNMVIGAICGGLVGGALGIVLGLALMLAPLIVIGFALVMLHGGFVLAVY